MPDIRVVAIVAAHNEEDVIAECVQALIDEGVTVYFIDDRSTDGTYAAVEPFVGNGVVGAERFDADAAGVPPGVFSWSAILARKEALAAELDADWFIHHDADEFRESPWPGLTLREAMARVDRLGYNALDFHVLNFWPTPRDPESGGVRERLRFFEPGRSWDRVQVKCWKRTAERVDLVSSGGHDVAFPHRRVFPIRFLLRHYPIRSASHGERKIARERLPRFDVAERERGWHVQYDDIARTQSWLRDAASLTEFDADVVRFELLTENRDVEMLTAAQQQLQQRYDELAAGFRRLDEHLHQQDTELEALRPVVAAQDAQLRALRDHLEVQDQELGRLRPLVTELEAEIARQQEAIRRLREIPALRRELAARDERLARVADDFRLTHQTNARMASEVERLQGELVEARALIADRERAVRQSHERLTEMRRSHSWRLTAPLRAVRRLLVRMGARS